MSENIVGASRRALFQALTAVLLSMVPGLFVASAKPIAYAVALIYLLVERRRVGRSWQEIGFRARAFKRDLFRNWHLILLVAIILQIPLPLFARMKWPALLVHIRERVPFLTPSSIGMLILTIVVIALVEELIFRGLLQQRLAWYLNGFVAILIASFVFSLQHLTPGAPTVVAADLSGVFIDGVVFGWIFERCGNILVSWTAHVAADIVGVVLLILCL
jgi:membrane protease YdiL (CAAX protease family)